MRTDNFNSPDHFSIEKLLNEENILVRNSTREWVKNNVSPIIEDANLENKFPMEFVKGIAG